MSAPDLLLLDRVDVAGQLWHRLALLTKIVDGNCTVGAQDCCLPTGAQLSQVKASLTSSVSMPTRCSVFHPEFLYRGGLSPSTGRTLRAMRRLSSRYRRMRRRRDDRARSVPRMCTSPLRKRSGSIRRIRSLPKIRFQGAAAGVCA